ncbi:MAG TPA: PKD domain-containing protein [Thermoplasmata archaeon]|nr:PKD domain-containing protein [Thermoplasmata archaeon]
MAYDPILHAVVFFGGQDPSGRALRDTWEYRTGGWTNLTASLATSPWPAWGDSVAYDPPLKGVLLFGGRQWTTANTSLSSATWLFNASGWRELHPVGAPSPRSPYQSMVYDPVAQEMVLFGGNYGTNYRMNDTWTFANNTWTNVSGRSTSAPSKYQLSGAYDTRANELVFYGGGTWFNGGYGATWTYAGGNWTDRTSTAGGPPPGTCGAPAFDYDPLLGEVLDYGGSGAGYCLANYNATWAYRSGSWTNLTAGVGPAPPSLGSGPMAFDAALNGSLVFSGINGRGRMINETWLLSDALRANATAAPNFGVAPMTVQLAGAFGPTPQAVAFNWSYGDGTANGTAQNVTHTFTTAGTYTVHLLVAGANGSRATASVTVVVHAPLALSAVASPSVGEVPLAVDFNASGGGGVPPIVFKWNFGDATTGFGGNLSHTYTAGGTFPWSLNESDSARHFRWAFGNVTVYGPLRASASASRLAGARPFPVAFSAAGSSGLAPYAFNWSFGDGSPPAASAWANHTYTVSGAFTARVNVTDAAGGWATYAIPIRVVDPVVAHANVTPLLGPAPLTVTYSAVPSGGSSSYSYAWTLGVPGVSSTSPSGTYTFSTAGTYVIHLNVTDMFGDSGQQNLTVRVAPSLTATASASATKGLAPFTVAFAPVVAGGFAPYSDLWTFGDGGTSNLSGTVRHTYANAGAYTAKLSVSSPDGETAMAQVAVAVGVVPSLRATVNVSTVGVGGSVAFLATVSGGFPPWTYSWGGLPHGCAGSTARNFACTPTGPGNYSVAVTAIDAIGDTANASVSLAVLPPPPARAGSGSASSFPVLDAVVGGVVGAAAIAAVVVVLRRRGGGPPSEPPDDASTPPSE